MVDTAITQMSARMSLGFSEALLLLGALLALAAALSGWLRASVLNVSVLAVVAGLVLAGLDVVTVDSGRTSSSTRSSWR